MISHRYHCIYVKVPKCASTSILHWFLNYCGAHRSMKPWWYGSLATDRVQAVTRVMNFYPDYLTFTFVRNPYERFLSIYRSAFWNTSQFPDLRDKLATCGSVREFAELCRDVLVDFGPLWGREACDFFRKNGEREYGPGKVRLKYLGWVIDHARPQTDFLPDCNPERLFGVKRVNGDPLAFIGRVEAMEADFHRLRGMLGLPGVALLHRNPSRSVAERGGPWTAYYDDATRRLVEDIYAADLAFTGCGFDDGRTTIAVPAFGTEAPAPRPVRRRRAGTILACAWFNLSSFEVRMEEKIRCFPTLRRLLRPLKRLRGLPR